MAEDVPLLLPEINAEHTRFDRCTAPQARLDAGALIANSNCTAMPVVMSLAPLLQFGVTEGFGGKYAVE